jgi:Mrp family chromosome partitioning ATPase
MNSTNSAFVKAFARRRVGSHLTTPTKIEETLASAPSPTAPESEPSRDQDSNAASLIHSLANSLASGEGVWVGPSQDIFARADQPLTRPPTPHVAPPAQAAPSAPPEPQPTEPRPTEPQPTELTRTTEQPIVDSYRTIEVNTFDTSPVPEALQHIHTAYAVAPVEFAYGRVEAEPISIAATDDLAEDRLATADREAADLGAPDFSEKDAVEPVRESSIPQTQQPPQSRVEHRIELPRAEQLSSRTQVAPVVPFQAVWEVDVFDIPRSVADLFFDGELFQQIAERMSEAVASGLNSVLVTSVQPGEGRSSVAIGMAMAAAAAGIRVALVDADTQSPSLADDLRLDLQYGWVDTIRGGLPIAEVAVHAVEDGVTLIPLMRPHGPIAATPTEVLQLLDVLRNRFELIIIDGPSSAVQSIPAGAGAVDTAIIVRDMTRTKAQQINDYSYRLRESGVKGVGVVENFA